MKEMIKLGGILFVITALCAGLLGAVHQMTQPIIEQNNVAAEKEAMQELLNEAKDFKNCPLEQQAPISKLFRGVDGEQTVGFVARVEPDGYGGKIDILVGMDAQGNVKGIKILSHSETPGFGANATKAEFLNQFKNCKTPLSLVKSTPKEGEIEAITGATITSTGVVTGVNDAANYVKQKEVK